MTAGLLETGGVLFGVTAASYAGSLANYVVALAKPKAAFEKLATGLRLFGLLFHTVYLAVRYYHAGIVEILEREAVGEVLTGYDRFWVFISHPPYTNLYESLMFITWCVMVAYAWIEHKWKLRPMGVVAVGITLAGLAEAYIVIEKDVRPLVPALQSWWILVHVGMIFLSYALLMLGAVVGVLYLVRAGVKSSLMASVHLAATALIVLLAGGLKSLVTRAAFEVTPIAQHTIPQKDGTVITKWMSLHWFPAGAQKAVRFWVEVPGVGPLALLAIVALGVAAFLSWRDYKRGLDGTATTGYRAVLAAFGVLTVALGWLVFKLATTAPFEPNATGGSLPSAMSGLARLSVGSNYNFGLLALAWASVAGFAGLVPLRAGLVERLPDLKKLDDLTYKVVIVAFPLLSIGIVMGAMWAFDAWGRYWGWDPKETWALITWALYAIYLHVRLTYGPGKYAAALAVFGFGVVVFTYMGVNLGLTGDGLHVYGSG